MQLRARFAAKSLASASLVILALHQTGCYSTQSGLLPPSVSRIFTPAPLIPNPLVVPSADYETVWNKTVAVVDKYFDIESENRLARTIRTQPQMGATLLEPWALDSVTFHDRLEASMQTIRRFAIIKIDPAPAGGYLVKVEVRKELEDLAKPDRQAAGRAVFYNEFPVNRVREIVGPVPVPLGWIPRGRDPNLEQAILTGIRDAFFL
jgi:hypothetical protein